MKQIILYPTETIYGLGVDALDPEALEALYALKGREEGKPMSWLVESVEDIEKYAEVGDVAAKIAERFLPGSLTLVLPAREHVPADVIAPDRTISFRISPDPLAAALAREIGAPLTATSANVSGMPSLSTPEEILAQFGEKASMITRVVDGGPRTGAASTVVRVIGDQIEILREGAIPQDAILDIRDNT